MHEAMILDLRYRRNTHRAPTRSFCNNLRIEFLKRSKSAPLQITFRRYPSNFEQFEQVAEAVMERISIQSLNIATMLGDVLL